MKSALLTMAATIAVFALGVLAGRWMQSTEPLPPPPMGLMGELRDMPMSGTPHAPRTFPPRDPEQLRAELERMRPAIEAFRRKLEPIKTEFRSSLEALLKPEQRERLKALDERFSLVTSSSHAGSDQERRRPRHERDGMDSIFPIVLVSATLERLTQELQLDEDQKAAVREILLKRRAQFLELVDTSPPPSLRLGRLAPLVPRLMEPEGK